MTSKSILRSQILQFSQLYGIQIFENQIFVCLPPNMYKFQEKANFYFVTLSLAYILPELG